MTEWNNTNRVNRYVTINEIGEIIDGAIEGATPLTEEQLDELFPLEPVLSQVSIQTEQNN